MMRMIFAIFIIMHGLVHLLYFGQSLRFFELQPGMTWPDGSSLLSKYFSVESIRLMTGIFCILVAVGFILSGIGMIGSFKWWRVLIVITAVLSIIAFILNWDGQWHNLDDQGVYSILINIMILAGMSVFA